MNLEQVKAQADELEEQKQYEQAIALLESALEQFPDDQYPITERLGVLYTQTEQYEKGLEIWEYGARRGFFYCHNPRWDVYKPYEQFERFGEILETDRRLRQEALAKSNMTYQVIAPAGYTGQEPFPLFIVLHGGNRTLEQARPYWNSTRLGGEYLAAFMQSYLHYGMESFGWARNDERAREGIRECFEEIVERYRVDVSQVLIGGISAGAMMAIEVAIDDVLPIAGFVGVCPVKPGEEAFNAEKVQRARERGQRAVLIAGENDTALLPQARDMVEVLEQTGFPHQFVVVPGLGHEYPGDFSDRLDAALAYINPNP
jgi:predicted esterase